MSRRIVRRAVSTSIEALEPRKLLTTYYIDSAIGNDANAGTAANAPWQSLGAVTLKRFKAGDSILLKGGQTHYGKLYLDSSDKATPQAPIKISSYGTGRATINAGNDSGILVINNGGIDISNLTVIGSGYPNNKTIGIYFYNAIAGDVKLPYVHINTVDVKGFKNGIGIGGGSGTSGYSDVQITYSTVHENAHAGIFTFGAAMFAHKGVYIGHCFTYDNVGIGADPGVSGHGIVLSSVEGGTVDRCTSYNNGALGNGGAGVWAYDSTKILFQYSTSFANRTAGPHDGDGFDFDQNVSSSVMQYNYSHDNDGAGYLMSTKFTNTLHRNNIIRYNISQNDARKLNYGALHIWGKAHNSEWYNNTVYLSPRADGSIDRYAIKIVNESIPANSVQSVHFRNNIIQTTGGVPLLYISGDQLNQASDIAFQGNCWFSTGASFKIKWGSFSYASLGSWRTARNQEKLNGAAVGFSGDPQLVGAGQGGTIGNADRLNRLTSYKLASTSPLINAGIDLSAFGIEEGGFDFWGTATPQGGKYDIGADEFS